MGTMHIVHERQNPTTSQYKVLTSSVEFVVLNGLVFTIRLGQGLGIAEISRSRLDLGLKGLVPIPANKQWNNIVIFRPGRARRKCQQVTDDIRNRK